MVDYRKVDVAKRDFKTIPLDVKILCIGGWTTTSGLIHSYYPRDISGQFERISELHYYNGNCGRDIYPDREQLAKMLAGETVTLHVDQWK